MRLKRFDVSLAHNAHGLDMRSMDRLGKVVAIVGPNGAGKSRLLRAVYDSVREDWAWRWHDPSLDAEIDATRMRIADKEGRLRRAGLATTVGEEQSVELVQSRRRLGELYKTQRRMAEFYEAEPRRNAFAALVNPARLRLEMPGDVTFSKLEADVGTALSAVRFERSAHGEHPMEVGLFFHRLAIAAFFSGHSEVRDCVAAGLYELYREAQRLIFELMGCKFGYITQGTTVWPALDGRKLINGELSEGQRVILGFVAGLLEGRVDLPNREKVSPLNGNIILLDEPELHIHPAVVADFIDKVCESVGADGQVWMATHSVPLLAHLELDQIWTMENGRVSAPGVDQHARTLALLVGEDAEVDRLREFAGQPAAFAAAKFAAECLVAPAVVGYKGDDPQVEVFMRALKELAQPGRKLTVLDYGAGRGRMAQGILETYGEVATEHIRYVAIEPDEGRHGEIRRAAGPLLGGDDLFTSVRAMPSRFDRDVDVAVICNVLHEVQPTLWCDEMTQLLARLTADGRVIVCEDQAMPHGERAHDLGFLILGAKEIGVLFGVAKPTQHLCPNEKYSERLVCVEMRGEQAQVTSESVRRAIVDLGRRVDGEIEMLSKRKVPGSADGRRYGLLCQLAVNATRSLKHIGGG